MDKKQFNVYIKESLISADTWTPISLFSTLVKDNPGFLLESVEKGEHWGRYSIVGLRPALILIEDKNGLTSQGKLATFFKDIGPDMVSAMGYVMNKLSPPDELLNNDGFVGGIVGFIGYDQVMRWEPIRKKPLNDPFNLPVSMAMLPSGIAIFDHLYQSLRLIGFDFEDDEMGAENILREMKEALKTPILPGSNNSSKDDPDIIPLSKKEIFKDSVAKTKEMIWDGEAIQVVLSQRFEAKIDVDAFQVYRSLRSINPSPYMFFLRFPDFHLMGSSPEVMVKMQGDKAILRPIAGTRARGANKAEDEKLADDLFFDEKERAEHVMLVDLARNDLGRVCEPGSIEVTSYMKIERYSHVMHMVSQVEGTLNKGLNFVELLKATFPAGTVSGAPKVRAMQIIDELEPFSRGPYAGAIGYSSFNGWFDTGITIRSIWEKNKVYQFQVGAGIVADSTPDREYIETLEKAGAMKKALKLATTFV